jgi:hypothetical protein
MRSWTAAVAVFSLSLLTSLPARADAREVAARVADEWRAGGIDVAVVPSRFVFDDETAIIQVPPAPPRRCTIVAIVGARGLSFRARLSDAPVDPLLSPEPAARASSSAGMVELRRCDPERPAVRHVVVTTEAGRGAIEVVVGHTDSAPPALAALVPERIGGASPSPPEAGVLPPLVAQDKRADAAEARARREGAVIRARTKLRASDDGSGEDEIELDEGCHRIEVFGRELARERPGRRFRLDLDAELKDGEHLLARDRTEAPDARLEACLGAKAQVTLSYAGSPPHSDVLVTHGSWPLPARLPPLWGPATRSKMARAMFMRHIAVPPDDAIYLAQGSTGTTPLPLEVETGGCYVAVVGVTRGRARQLQLRALVGGRESTDERGATEEAALSAFCVRAHEQAKLEVLARGPGLGWGVAVFRLKSAVWEAGR